MKPRLDNELTMVHLENSLDRIGKHMFNVNVVQEEKKSKEPKQNGNNAKLEEVIEKHDAGDETYYPLGKLELFQSI